MTRVGETNLIVSGGISCDFLIYITTKTFEEKINCHCIDESYVRAQEFTPKFIGNTVLLPSDVVDLSFACSETWDGKQFSCWISWDPYPC